jgi:hypothetical protein
MKQCWKFLKTRGEKGCHAEHPLYAPKFPQLWTYFMIKNRQIIFPKVVYRTPPENAFMNVYFYFYSVVKCGNRALGINERIKKIFSDTKTNPNPPLSRSDRGPSGGPVPKVFRKRAPSGQWEACISHCCLQTEISKEILRFVLLVRYRSRTVV